MSGLYSEYMANTLDTSSYKEMHLFLHEVVEPHLYTIINSLQYINVTGS